MGDSKSYLTPPIIADADRVKFGRRLAAVRSILSDNTDTQGLFEDSDASPARRPIESLWARLCTPESAPSTTLAVDRQLIMERNFSVELNEQKVRELVELAILHYVHEKCMDDSQVSPIYGGTVANPAPKERWWITRKLLGESTETYIHPLEPDQIADDVYAHILLPMMREIEALNSHQSHAPDDRWRSRDYRQPPNDSGIEL